MIIVDTNIISELMRSTPDRRVTSWLEALDPATVWVTSVSVAEIHYGLNLLPAGRRRDALSRAFEQALVEAFAGRVLSFDESAASHYGRLMAARRAAGLPMAALDGQIAAIALAASAALATRDIRDFQQCGLELVDPFDV